VYLGATALGLGACGIGAIYDGEARSLLGLSSESALVYVVAAGTVKGNYAVQEKATVRKRQQEHNRQSL